MTEINIEDRYIYQGIPFEVIALASGARGGLVWVAYPPNTREKTSSVVCYIRDEFVKLIEAGTIVKVET